MPLKTISVKKLPPRCGHVSTKYNELFQKMTNKRAVGWPFGKDDPKTVQSRLFGVCRYHGIKVRTRIDYVAGLIYVWKA